MKIGICSTDFENDSIDGIFKKIHKYGFDAVQFSYVSIGMDEIPKEIPDEIIDEINASLKKYDVEIVAVNATFNLIDHDKKRLERNIKNMETMCKANKKLGCKLLTLCTGSRSHESMWSYHPDTAKKDAWDELMMNIKPVIKTAEKYDMYLGIETEAKNVVMTPDMARKFIDESGSDRMKVILDCANLFHAGDAHKENVEKTIRDAFDKLGNDIILAHGKDIAESDGIDFAPVGEGIVDYDLFLELLKKYNYKGAMVIHGIYDESLMDGCVKFIKEKIKEHNM